MARYHKHPVHFNRGRHGHVWLCLACGKQLSGPSLPLDEKEALIQFAKFYSEEIKTAKAATALQEHKGEKVMKLEIAMLVGPEAKGFLANLTAQLDRMEKLTAGTPTTAPKKTAAAPVTDEDEDTTVETDDDEDFAPKKKTAAKKAAASFDADEDDETPAATEDDEEDFTAKAPAKKAAAPKAKKLTVDDVNDACKKRAAQTGGKEGRAEVLGILKKKFKTESVSDLKPEQYPAVIAAMEA